MEINDFIQKLEEVFEDSDINTIKPDTKFRELPEWSSLSALSLIALADEEFGKEITGNDIKSSQTIQDLFNLMNA